MRRALAAGVVLWIVALLSCRQIAGIHDIELGVPAEAGADSPAPPEAGRDARSDGGRDAGRDARAPGDASEAQADAGCPATDGSPCECPCCTTLARDLDNPFSLVVSGTEAYALAFGGGASKNGALVRASTAGGKVSTLVANLTAPVALATDTTNLYWYDYSGTDGRIEKLPMADPDAGVTAIATGQPDPYLLETRYNPTNTLLTVSSKAAYWIGLNDVTTDAGSSFVYFINTVPLGGGTVTTFLNDFPSPEATAFAPVALQTDNTSLFVLAGGAFEGVLEVPLSDPTTGTVVTQGLNAPVNLTLAGSDVLIENSPFLSCAKGSLLSVPDKGGKTTNLAKDLVAPWAGVVDGSVVYVADNGTRSCGGSGGSGSIVKLPVGGGAVKTLATANTPEAIAVDSESVYWVDSACGTLMKAPK